MAELGDYDYVRGEYDSGENEEDVKGKVRTLYGFPPPRLRTHRLYVGVGRDRFSAGWKDTRR